MDPLTLTILLAVIVLFAGGLLSPWFFVRARRARLDVAHLRKQLEQLQSEKDSLALVNVDKESKLTERSAQLSNAEEQIVRLHGEVTLLRASRNYEHLERALDESGFRNETLRRENEQLQQALRKSSYDLEYMRALGKRYRHDSIDRLKLLGKILDSATGGLDADTLALGKQQLEFILESLDVNLAESISEYVKRAATERKDSFNLTKRVTRLVDTFREQDQLGRISIKTETTDAWMWGNWLHVELLLSNLITNALNHGSKEGPIEVDLRQEGDRAIVEVENEGSPFDAEKIVSERQLASGKPRFGLFFVREVVAGFEGRCEWRPTRKIRGAGKNQKETAGMKAVITLPLIAAQPSAAVHTAASSNA